MGIKGFEIDGATKDNDLIQVKAECKICNEGMGLKKASISTLRKEGKLDDEITKENYVEEGKYMGVCNSCRSNPETYKKCSLCGLPMELKTYFTNISNNSFGSLYDTRCGHCHELVSYKGEELNDNLYEAITELGKLKIIITNINKSGEIKNIPEVNSMIYKISMSIDEEVNDLVRSNRYERDNTQIDYDRSGESIKQYLNKIGYTRVLGVENNGR